MTTAGYDANNPFAVAGKTSYILCHQPKSLDWRARGGKPHPLKQLAVGPFEQACMVLNQIVQIA